MEVYTVTFEFPHGKIPTKSWQLCFPFVFLALSISFLSPTEYFRNEIPPRSCLIRERNGPLCEKRVRGGGWYRRFDDRGSRKCARAWQAERKKSSSKARLAVHCASCVPNWNVTILWKTGTHRRTTISNISYDSWIDRKEFFDIEDRGIQSCATNEKKIILMSFNNTEAVLKLLTSMIENESERKDSCSRTWSFAKSFWAGRCSWQFIKARCMYPPFGWGKVTSKVGGPCLFPFPMMDRGASILLASYFSSPDLPLSIHPPLYLRLSAVQRYASADRIGRELAEVQPTPTNWL